MWRYSCNKEPVGHLLSVSCILAGTVIEHVIAIDTLTEAQQKLLIILVLKFKNKGKSV